jgi:hypothetical protein
MLIVQVVLVQFCTQGLAKLAASVTRSFATASVIGNALNLFQIMSAGFILVDVPPYVSWIRWISPYFYSFSTYLLSHIRRGGGADCTGIMSTTQFRDRTFDCPANSLANLGQVRSCFLTI